MTEKEYMNFKFGKHFHELKQASRQLHDFLNILLQFSDLKSIGKSPPSFISQNDPQTLFLTFMVKFTQQGELQKGISTPSYRKSNENLVPGGRTRFESFFAFSPTGSGDSRRANITYE